MNFERRHGFATFTVLMLASVALAACGGGDSGPKVAEKNVSTTTTAPKASAQGTVRAYFKALASGDPTTMNTMSENTVPGSVAAKYALIQTAYAQVFADSGNRDSPSYYSEDGGKIRTCNTSPTATSTTTSADGTKDCTEFSNFVVDKRTHKLSDFKANGIDISSRIVTGGSAARSVDGGCD